MMFHSVRLSAEIEILLGSNHNWNKNLESCGITEHVQAELFDTRLFSRSFTRCSRTDQVNCALSSQTSQTSLTQNVLCHSLPEHVLAPRNFK